MGLFGPPAHGGLAAGGAARHQRSPTGVAQRDAAGHQWDRARPGRCADAHPAARARGQRLGGGRGLPGAAVVVDVRAGHHRHTAAAVHGGVGLVLCAGQCLPGSWCGLVHAGRRLRRTGVSLQVLCGAAGPGLRGAHPGLAARSLVGAGADVRRGASIDRGQRGVQCHARLDQRDVQRVQPQRGRPVESEDAAHLRRHGGVPAHALAALAGAARAKCRWRGAQDPAGAGRAVAVSHSAVRGHQPATHHRPALAAGLCAAVRGLGRAAPRCALVAPLVELDAGAVDPAPAHRGRGGVGTAVVVAKDPAV